MGLLGIIRVIAGGLLLSLCLLGCVADNQMDVEEIDSGEDETDSNRLDDTEHPSMATESDAETGQDGTTDPENNLPEPAEPCAQDPDADQHENSDVNQVTGVVCPDLGKVEPGEPFEGDLEDDGEFDVFTKSVKIPIQKGTLTAAGYEMKVESGSLPGTIDAPSSDRGKTVVSEKLPLLLVLAGFQVSYTWYGHYSRHFASHGFAVLGVKTRSELTKASHDKEVFEIKQALDWIETAETPLKDKLDLTKVAIAAHSKGGKLAFFAAAIDDRIDVVIAWDPNNNGGPPCSLPLGECNAFPVAPNCAANDPGVQHLMRAESLVLGMPRDGLNPDRHHNSIHFYRGAPSPASLVYYDAGHLGSIFNPRVIQLNKKVQLALLLTRFKGVPGLEEFLPSTQEGELHILQHSVVARVESK